MSGSNLSYEEWKKDITESIYKTLIAKVEWDDPILAEEIAEAVIEKLTGGRMKELLKQIQEIFPGTKIENNDLEGQNIVINENLCVAFYSNSYKLVSSDIGGCENCDQDSIVCESKDFSKILAVLKAIKECECEKN